MSDDFDDDFESDVLVDFELNVEMIRMVENIFMPVRIRLRAEVIPHTTTSETLEIAFAKIKFWFDNIISRSIIFGKNNAAALAMLLNEESRNASGNILVLTPEDPTDEHLAVLFQAKMTALAAGTMEFGSVEIRSDNHTGLLFTFIGDAGAVLPSMAEWIGERSYFEQPWWMRDDASTLDVTPGEDADLAQKPAWAYSLDFLANVVRPAQDEVIVRPEFKPTVHDGGKA